MASAMPDLLLPSQPQGVTAPWPVPITKLYCLVTEAHEYEWAYTMTATDHDHDGHSNENVKN